MKCKKCESDNLKKEYQTHSNGIKHLRVDCAECGAFVQYEKQPEGAKVVPMKDKLRPYQKQLIASTYAELKQVQKVLAVLSTGGGKTFIFSSISKDGQDHERRVLILTDRILLNDQTVKSLEFAGCNVGIINNGEYDKPVSIATVQTAANRLDVIKPPNLVVIDEAHEGIFKKCMDWWPDAKYIGFTGTPISGTKKDPLKNYWDSAVASIPRPELIEQGNLLPIKSKVTAFDLSGLKKSSADYSEKSQYEVFGTETCYNAFHSQLSEADAMKTIVFCSSVKLTLEVCERLNSWGYAAWAIVGGTKAAERKEILSKFKETPNSFLVNCMVATKGFDEPSAQRAVFFYATISLAKYYQTGGRVCRPFQGQEFAEVWDYGGNVERFWDLNAKVDWVDMFNNPPKAGEGIAPMKDCPQCQALIRSSATKCGYCSYEFPKTKKQLLEEEKLRLVEIKAKSPLFAAMTNARQSEHVGIFERAYNSGGVNEAKQLMKFCQQDKVSGYKNAYWIFSCARGIYKAAYKQAFELNPTDANIKGASDLNACYEVKSAFGFMNEDFFAAVLSTASNNKESVDIFNSLSAKYFLQKDLDAFCDNRENKSESGFLHTCNNCGDVVITDDEGPGGPVFCDREECIKAEWNYHVG